MMPKDQGESIIQAEAAARLGLILALDGMAVPFMSKVQLGGAVIKFLLGVLAVFAASICSADPDLSTMAIVRDADIKWTESPRSPGLSMAVVYGDPAMPGLYIIRVRFAVGAMSRPHFHPEERYIAVLKGTWWVGAGPKWDRNATTPVPAGSFVVHHPNKIHYDGAKDEEVTLQITGIGPSATKLVDESGEVAK